MGPAGVIHKKKGVVLSVAENITAAVEFMHTYLGRSVVDLNLDKKQ